MPDFLIEVLDKILDGQNFSSDKIFDTKLKFWQFCPTNFCPIRYYSKHISNGPRKKNLFKFQLDSKKMCIGGLNKLISFATSLITSLKKSSGKILKYFDDSLEESKNRSFDSKLDIKKKYIQFHLKDFSFPASLLPSSIQSWIHSGFFFIEV